MRERPRVSVVVSVRGNTAVVGGLLDKLAAQTFTDLEVVVVDNGRRASPTLAHDVRCGSWPFPVRVLRERRAGAARGRNRGMRDARGRYIVLTDPDIRPRPTWLGALVTAAVEEDAAVVGGRVVTYYPDGMGLPMDHHTARPLAECHGPLDWPKCRTPYGWPYWIVTASMLVDSIALTRLGYLRVDLGRRGPIPLDCEDLEFADRAIRAGLRVVIEPAAVADHPVGPDRTRTGWFFAQGLCHGICVARMRTTVHVPALAIRAGPGGVGDALTALLAAWTFLDSVSAVVGLRDLARIAGYHIERLRLAVTGHRLLPLSPGPATTPGEHQ